MKTSNQGFGVSGFWGVWYPYFPFKGGSLFCQGWGPLTPIPEEGGVHNLFFGARVKAEYEGAGGADAGRPGLHDLHDLKS